MSESESESVRLLLGDCLILKDQIGHVDAVVSDPPYGMDWDTDCGRFSGGEAHHRAASPGRTWDEEEQIEGDDKAFDPSPWLGYRKVILFGSNHFGSRLPVGTTLIWVKRNEAAYGSFLSDAEMAWMKGGHGVYLRKDLSMNALAKTRVHPNQKPIPLMKWCIEKLNLRPSSTILDPYMGSGSTGIAALELGHNFIGIESKPKHFATAEARIAAARSATPLFAAV